MRLAVLALLLGLAGALHAQSFPLPGKPVRIVVPFPPGGATDIQARVIAQKMTESMPVSVVVENKPGGSTMIGTREVLKAAPDGHTLLYTIRVIVQLPHLYRSPPWEDFSDFTPITAVAIGGTALTSHESVPASNLRSTLAHPRSHPPPL